MSPGYCKAGKCNVCQFQQHKNPLRTIRERVLLGAPRLAGAVVQYIFFGNIWLRSALKWRFTAAAFLRLRSEVGFS